MAWTFDRTVRRRRLLAGALSTAAGAAALPLVGCAPGEDEDPAQATPPAEGATPTPAPEQPRQGGTWNRGAGANITLGALPYQDVGTLAGGGNAAARDPGLIFGNLVRYADDKVEVIPDHAKEWEIAKDGKSIKLVLRDDIFWHSGRKFTTKDIAFNFEEVRKERWKASHGARLNPVADYQIIDDYTMVWNFKTPNPPVLEFMSVFRFADMDTFDKIAGGTLIGTGAFKWTRFDPVQGASLVANEKYHLGRPLLDRIEYTIFADPAALSIALETGRITDSALTAEEAERFFDNNNFRTVKLQLTGSTIPIGIRTDLPPLQDRRLRQAIGFMLDRERYQKERFVGRYDELGRLPWPKFSPAHDPELDKPIYDLQRAKDLVREAGFPRGVPTPIRMNTLPIRPFSTAIAQLLQQEGREIGLNFEFVPLEHAHKLERYMRGALDNIWIGFGDSGSPLSPRVSLLFATLLDGMPTNYRGPEYHAARQAIVDGGTDYGRFNRAFLDAAHALVLARPTPLNFESPRIHISRNVLGWINYHKVWVS